MHTCEHRPPADLESQVYLCAGHARHRYPRHHSVPGISLLPHTANIRAVRPRPWSALFPNDSQIPGAHSRQKEKKLMFNKKALFVIAVLGFLGVSASKAQVSASCPYTLASIRGTYAIVVNNGANVAMAIGTRSYDGNGN